MMPLRNCSPWQDTGVYTLWCSRRRLGVKCYAPPDVSAYFLQRPQEGCTPMVMLSNTGQIMLPEVLQQALRLQRGDQLEVSIGCDRRVLARVPSGPGQPWRCRRGRSRAHAWWRASPLFQARGAQCRSIGFVDENECRPLHNGRAGAYEGDFDIFDLAFPRTP